VGFLTDHFFYRVSLACQNDLPMTPEHIAYLRKCVAVDLSQRKKNKVPSMGGPAELMEGASPLVPAPTAPLASAASRHGDCVQQQWRLVRRHL
jgi:hypothetical protein